MAITIKEVKSRRDLRVFIHLPEKIHQFHKNWLPPIYVDEWKFFNPKKNRAFSHCDTILLLGYEGDRPVGRVMGIINRSYNEFHNETNARFGYLECYDKQEIAHALLQAVEDWARKFGMKKLVGPYGFSDKDPQGLQISGFDEDPTLAAPCNEEYLVKIVEKEGYEKEVDCLMFTHPVAKGIPENYQVLTERIMRNKEFRLIEPASKKELKPYVIPVLQMVNDTYADIYGFLPMDDQEMKDFADRYMPVLDPRFVKLISVDDKLIAFMIGLPSLAKGIQACRGYLFPFGIFKLIKEAKATRQLDLMLGGVEPEYQNKGLAVVLVYRMFDSIVKAGFERLDIHLVLETNHKMLAELERGGAKSHKRFRVFNKFL
jgi:hypothetical protein